MGSLIINIQLLNVIYLLIKLRLQYLFNLKFIKYNNYKNNLIIFVTNLINKYID